MEAVATAGGWLLVRTVPKTGCNNVGTKLQVVQLTGKDAQVGAEIDLGTYPQRVRLVPRSAGAWLLYHEQPEGLLATRLDALGQIEMGPVAISAPVQTPYPFAADAVSGGLVVALIDDPSFDPKDLTIAVTDEEGTRIASALLHDVPASQFTLEVAFDQATRQALVAISMPHEYSEFSVHVARFSCQ
jgi:hypothetical protein